MSNLKNRVKSKKTDEHNERLRILCLHGYRQNGPNFKAKIGSVRKCLQRYADFVFISAPHNVTKTNDDTSIEADENEDAEKGWWFNSDDRTFKGTNKNGPAFGFDESLHLVEEAWQTLGPFQGILGFSQGACFVGLICNLAMRGMTKINSQFAILAAGFRSGSLAHSNYYEDVITIPSMHIFGESDLIITSEMSKSLAEYFDDPMIVEHPGGHYFPASPSQKTNYCEFLEQRLIDCLEQRELERDDAVIIDPLDDIPSTSSQTGIISEDSE